MHSADKAGKDVGELIGEEPIGVTATNNVDEILALDADAVVYSPLLPNPDEVAALLRSGKNVVTPVGWVYPSERQSVALRDAAIEGDATLHGTGIAPGGISEKFPLLFSAFSTGVTFVRAEEYSDLRTYEAPDVVRHVMGFGEVPDKALSGPMQKLLDGGFIQAVRMIVDKAGFNADPKVRSSQEIAVATAPIESPIGVIEPGQVAGRKFHWEALVGDEVVVRVTVNWLMGEEKLDPAWTFGPEGQRYEMEVRGNPDISISVKGFQLRGRRRGAGIRHRRHRGALRELGACGVRRRTGHRDLSRSAADQRQSRAPIELADYPLRFLQSRLNTGLFRRSQPWLLCRP